MLSLSQTTGYAILALACLVTTQGHWVKVREISECTGIPGPYLSKLLNQLGKAGIVVAKRGSFGGYCLTNPPKDTSLLQVAEAVEGDSWMPKCLLGFAHCSDDRACPTHEFWSKERTRIEARLTRISVRDVSKFEHKRQRRLGSCCEPPVPPKGRAVRVSRSTSKRLIDRWE